MLHRVVFNLKRSLSTVTYHGTKVKRESGPPPCNTLSRPAPWHSSEVTLVARPVLMPVNQKLCMCEHGLLSVNPPALLASKSFAAVRETFSSAYLDMGISSKRIHRQVTIFRYTGSTSLRQVLIEWQNSWNCCHVDFREFSYKKEVIRLQEFIPLVSSLCVLRCFCVLVRIAFQIDHNVYSYNNDKSNNLCDWHARIWTWKQVTYVIVTDL
jgi:hypothetical protein